MSMATIHVGVKNPCLSCGACCTYFRASFHWSEADDAGGTVPVALTVDIDQHRRAMVGTTDKQNCRCIDNPEIPEDITSDVLLI